MPGLIDRPLDISGLAHALGEVDPAAVLVSPRLLRRVIKRDRGLPFLTFHALHQQVYTIRVEDLRRAVGEVALGPRAEARRQDDPLILLARPDPDDLAASSRGAVLDHYWRLLFHARVHLALDQRLAGATAAGALRDRVARIGPVEFEEVGAVLRQDGTLLPPYGDREVYVEFAATYLGLRHFAPSLLPHVFPGIEDQKGIDTLLAEDLDAPTLLAATRPPGAPGLDRAAIAAEPAESLPATEEEEDGTTVPGPTRGLPRWLIHRAIAVGDRGNVVRAAILRTQAAQTGPAPLAEPFRIGARAEVDRLARRLRRALGFDDAELERWRQALPPLLDRSARGFWTPEARLLFDLQKVCVDHEREVFTIDLSGWLASRGGSPLRRPQPHLRDVMVSNHLRRAARRLRSVQLGRDDRARLDALLGSAVGRAEQTLRDRFRGAIDITLEATGLRPRNTPERVAFRKLIEELLDRIVGRGFLTLGDLRDACSRSNLKMPDLAGPIEFVRGDRLLQADRALARALDGVYRHGEVYLRWLQRFSSLAFGTRIGRFLSLYAALPFGGARIVLGGLEHLVELIGSPFGIWHQIHLANPSSVLLLGTVALGAINFVGFRRRLLAWLGAFWRGLRAVLFDLPAWVLSHRLVRLVFEGRAALLAWRVALKPALATLAIWGLSRTLSLMAGRTVSLLAERRGPLLWREDPLFLAVVFVSMGLVLNSRPGRDAEEILADEAVRTWRQLHRDLIPGLIRLIMATFDRILEAVERLLYAVDEWLRFRSGQGRLSLVAKAMLGAVWACVAYLVRIYVNLLIEPQVNPIKHFPVVTVSHKIMLPFLKPLARLMAAPLKPLLGKWTADAIAWSNVLLLPGLFGFLVWEFKENWRLYAANRRGALGPVIVGGHGETFARLLRPGFHSGTLPKLFARLRKSERRALEVGRERAALRHQASLHHVEDEVRRFVDREFVGILRESRVLGMVGIEAGEITLATNAVRIAFHAADESGPTFRVEFAERSGRLVAGLTDADGLALMTDARRRVLTTALAGLFKLSGVDLIQTADAESTDFRHVVVTWGQWVAAWERDQAGQGPPPRFVKALGLPSAPERPRGRRHRTSRR